MPAQFCLGLPPKSLYPNMSPDMRGLSSSGREVWPHLRVLGQGALASARRLVRIAWNEGSCSDLGTQQVLRKG